MNKLITKTLIALAGVFVFAAAASAQAPKRLNFNQSTSLVWEENVPGNTTRSFVFRAEKGQKLKLSLIDDTHAGQMDFGKVSIDPDSSEPFETEIEVTKDYNLSVTNNTRKATSFRIMVSLEDPEIATEFDPADGIRLTFAKGDNSTYMTKDIPANGSLDFLVNVKKNQELGFQVGYEGNASNVQVFMTEPGMQDITIQAGPEERKAFKVKKTGDHRITVNNMTKRKITMTIYVDAY